MNIAGIKIYVLADQCALNPDGTLKEASEINFFYDPDDATPIASGNRTSGTPNFFILGLSSDHLSRTARPRDTA